MILLQILRVLGFTHWRKLDVAIAGHDIDGRLKVLCLVNLRDGLDDAGSGNHPTELKPWPSLYLLFPVAPAYVIVSLFYCN